MAFDLFKWFSTGNGETEEPKPKPKSTPSPQATTKPKPQPAPTVQRDFSQPAAVFGPVPGSTRSRQGGGSFDPVPGSTRSRQGGGSFDPVPGSTRSRQGGGSFDQPGEQPKPEPDKPNNFLERMGQAQVDRGAQPRGAVEDVFNWLTEPVNSPDEFFQPVGGTTDRIKRAETEKAVAAEQAAEERSSWATGLGSTGSPTARQVTELTWDQYDALTPRQRAAVDANTMLVNAVRQDLAGGATGSADSDYDSAVSALFGEQGGSDTYAPATVNALTALGIKDTTRGDLDTYLDQSALLGQDDLDAMLADRSGWSEEQVLDDKRGLNALQFSGQAISSLRNTLAGGGAPRSGVSPTSTAAGDLNDLFEMLNTRSNYDSLGDQDVSEILGLFLQDTGLDAGTVTRYFDDRLNAFDYGAAEVPADKISTAEFRSRYFGGQ
jgi:hypothetical protein